MNPYSFQKLKDITQRGIIMMTYILSKEQLTKINSYLKSFPQKLKSNENTSIKTDQKNKKRPYIRLNVVRTVLNDVEQIYVLYIENVGTADAHMISFSSDERNGDHADLVLRSFENMQNISLKKGESVSFPWRFVDLENNEIKGHAPRTRLIISYYDDDGERFINTQMVISDDSIAQVDPVDTKAHRRHVSIADTFKNAHMSKRR